MTRSVSIAQLKAHLSEVVGEVQYTHARIVIEKHGKAVAMLVPLVGQRAEGLLGLAGAFDDVPEFAQTIEGVVKSRRSEGRRRVPRLK